MSAPALTQDPVPRSEGDAGDLHPSLLRRVLSFARQVLPDDNIVYLVSASRAEAVQSDAREAYLGAGGGELVSAESVDRADDTGGSSQT